MAIPYMEHLGKNVMASFSNTPKTGRFGVTFPFLKMNMLCVTLSHVCIKKIVLKIFGCEEKANVTTLCVRNATFEGNSKGPISRWCLSQTIGINRLKTQRHKYIDTIRRTQTHKCTKIHIHKYTKTPKHKYTNTKGPIGGWCPSQTIDVNLGHISLRQLFRIQSYSQNKVTGCFMESDSWV